MRRLWWLLFLPALALADEEWAGLDTTDGYSIGATIDAAYTAPAAPPATGTPIRVGIAQFTPDTSTFDVTWTGAGTPTGVLVFASGATANDTTAAWARMSCGVSDFTTTAIASMSMEDNVTPTDSRRKHQASNVIEILDDTATPVRTATVATTTDGVRFTPGEAGTQYRMIVIGVFDSDATAFSTGSGTTANDNFQVAHGLGVAPSGIYCYNGLSGSNNTQGALSIGFSTGTTQRAMGWRYRDGQADGAAYARVLDDAVGMLINNSGGTFHEIQLTGNDATNITFTARLATTAGDLIGLLLPAIGYSIDVDTLTSPNATGTWTNSDPGFEAGSAIILANQAATIDAALNDSPEAGTVSLFATDMTTEASAAIMDENAANPSDTASRLSTELWLGDDDQVEDYACNTFSGTASGFSATCDTANGTTHQWLAFITQAEAADAGTGAIMRRRR